MAFVDLEIGFHYAVVQRAVGLADTAAKFVSGRSVKDAAGHLVALFGCSLSDKIVEVKGLAGLKDKAVDRFADKVNIRIAVRNIGCLRRRCADET